MTSTQSLIPRPWHHSHGACPPVLGITLHRPWAWAFFGRTLRNPRWPLEPGLKDVENRPANFPQVPPGTWLALHNGTHWDKSAEDVILRRLPSTQWLDATSCPPGVIIGAVQVRSIMRTTSVSGSRWRLPWSTAIWLEEERLLLPEPLPCPRGWFGAWNLPEPTLAALLPQLPAVPR